MKEMIMNEKIKRDKRKRKMFETLITKKPRLNKKIKSET